MTKLSDSTAVHVARDTLAAYDAGVEQDGEIWWSVNPAYWAGRVAQALRAVLTEIGEAEGEGDCGATDGRAACTLRPGHGHVHWDDRAQHEWDDETDGGTP